MTASASLRLMASPGNLNDTNHFLNANSDTSFYPSSTSNVQESRNPSQRKHDSKVSIATKASVNSTRSHQEYIDSLEVPCKAELERIGTVQERKEEEQIMKRLSHDHPWLSEEERVKAAALIQRSYRGHRERRMLEGMSLDPSTRWVEAIKEARYRNMTQPRSRANPDVSRVNSNDDGSADLGAGDRHIAARQNWKKIGLIARRAGGDEDSESENSDVDENATENERDEQRRQRMEEKKQRQRAAKMMDLQYFLEMVDVKHR